MIQIFQQPLTGCRILSIYGLTPTWRLSERCCDVQSQNYRSALVNAIASKSSSDHLAGAFDYYIHQALERSCATRVTNMAARTRTGPKWYNRELRLKRSLAIKAGETMYNGTCNGDLLTHCREYRSMKQRKQWEYRRKCLESIEYAYRHDRQSMWKVLKNIDNEHKVSIEPRDDEFYLFLRRSHQQMIWFTLMKNMNMKLNYFYVNTIMLVYQTLTLILNNIPSIKNFQLTRLKPSLIHLRAINIQE